MCGLAGFTVAGMAPDDRGVTIANMLRRIGHRGPDEQGVYANDDFVFGHNRLTVIEPHGGRQPRIHERSGNVLLFNGEIYNHRAFDRDIERRGGELRDHCDTETLFWLLQLDGIEKTLARVDGMFAFAWYEHASRTLHLARDRFGQKPLFYSHQDGGLVFASEIKALRRHPALARVAPDWSALRLYLMLEYVPAPLTGIEGLREVPAGHVVRFPDGRADSRRYWSAAEVRRDFDGTPAAAAAELDSVLRRTVREQLVADVPVGVFLSGGLDSSLIAAVAKQQSADVATFTVRFPYPSFDESAHAEKVARHVGTRHATIELRARDCTDGMSDLLEQVDQPFADSSMLPSYLLCKATRQQVTVALGGDGADELFLGYPNFRLHRAARWMSRLPAFAGSLLRGVAGLLPTSVGYMSTAFLLRQLSYGIGRPAALQNFLWMSALPAREQGRLFRDGAALRTADLAALPGMYCESGGTTLETYQRQFIDLYLAGDILQKMDRASMQASLEVRSPYLSNAVSGLAMRLPLEYHLAGTAGKRLLRQVANAYLPPDIVNRRKHGFALPMSAMLKADLRELAGAILLDATNGLYELAHREQVETWWSEHQRGRRDHGKRLGALLMLAAFFRNQF